MTALLMLEDGSVFHGRSVGASGFAVGEVVFNTAMTGYQEILTDPSYARQIVTLTYPYIGNTGVNAGDAESARVWAAGLVIRDCPALASSWRLEQTLPEYLAANDIVAIAELDTRRLTRHIRQEGALAGCIAAGVESAEPAAALAKARAFPGIGGMDLVKVVSRKSPTAWAEGAWSSEGGYREAVPAADAPHVVAYDFGVKRNILRLLAERGCRVTVVPAQTTAAAALALEPDGVFLSNGPGDPAPCGYAIDAAKAFLARRLPLFGICLGHQILALAAGGKTVKMPSATTAPIIRCRISPPRPSTSPARTTASRWTAIRSRRRCASPMSRCSTAPCRASPAPMPRRSASKCGDWRTGQFPLTQDADAPLGPAQLRIKLPGVLGPFCDSADRTPQGLVARHWGYGQSAALFAPIEPIAVLLAIGRALAGSTRRT